MKPINLSTKLSLNKKTIAHLESIELKEIQGGNVPVSEYINKDSGCIVCYDLSITCNSVCTWICC